MKLESLELNKFKKDALKKEQMFMLNGSGTRTPPGNRTGGAGENWEGINYDYGFDAVRSNGQITYHNRSNGKKVEIIAA